MLFFGRDKNPVKGWIQVSGFRIWGLATPRMRIRVTEQRTAEPQNTEPQNFEGWFRFKPGSAVNQIISLRMISRLWAFFP